MGTSLKRGLLECVCETADAFFGFYFNRPSLHQLANDFAAIFIDKVSRKFGIPEELTSNRDSWCTRLTGRFMREICKVLCISQSRSSAHQPETDGHIEYCTSEMLRHLSALNKQMGTSNCIVRRVLTTVHSKPAIGFLPSELNYGCQTRSLVI